MKLRLICVVMLCALFIMNLPVHLSAMTTGFEVEEIPESQIEKIIANLNVNVFYEEPTKKGIDCFDVSGTGHIAVGSVGNDPHVCIYDSNGDFLYGLSFSVAGAFDIEWNDDKLIIYTVRGNNAILVGADGGVEEICSIKDTAENSYYWRKTINSNIRIVDGNTYEIRTNMGILDHFSPAKTQILVTDSNGVSKIIYDINAEYTVKFIIIIWVVVSTLALVIYHKLRKY